MLSPAYILNILTSECGYRDGDSILVGVSGGADSVALLHLIHAAGIPCAAAHVNYGLRGEESDGDEKFVAEECAQLSIPLYIRRIENGQLSMSNLQGNARQIRYEFFKEIVRKESTTWIATAHHSDDQLETVLINLMRGTGINGMGAMKIVADNIVRPLLHLDRKSIEHYCLGNGFKWRNDSSNAGDDYLRNRIRHHVIPPLQRADERQSAGWKTTISNLNESADLLNALMKPWMDRVVIPHVHAFHFDKEELAAFPFPHLLLNHLLAELVGVEHKFTSEQTQQILTQQPGKKYLFEGLRLVVDREVLILHGDHEEPWYPFALIPGDLSSKEWFCKTTEPVAPEKYHGFEALVDSDGFSGNLVVRKWKPADKFHPLGFEGTKNVSDILTEMKVPLNDKERYPVVTFENEIVWIPGYRIAEKYKITHETKTALHIKWNR